MGRGTPGLGRSHYKGPTAVNSLARIGIACTHSHGTRWPDRETASCVSSDAPAMTGWDTKTKVMNGNSRLSQQP